MNPNPGKYRIGVADSRNSHFYFRGVCEQLDVILVDDVTAAQLESGLELDLCIVTGEYWPEQIFLLSAAKSRGIPTLHIMDGVLEWRNTWEHPQLISPFLQPVMADKVACLGRSQARILESWGNYSKCEVVGSPRLDPLLDYRRSAGPVRDYALLVASAKTPWFNSTQKSRVVQGLIDLQKGIAESAKTNGTYTRIIWRLQDELFDELFEQGSATNHAGDKLADLLHQADALITTPSTVMLEGMLCGIPVAVIDYTNSPQYVQSAWSITASEHISQVLTELRMPPQSKLVLQDYYLHDALECYSPAGPRLARLIEEMLRIKSAGIAMKKKLGFPLNILEQTRGSHHLPEARFDLAKLYPHHPVYSDYDKSSLQAELLHCRKKLENLSEEISLLKRDGNFTLANYLTRHFRWLGKVRKIIRRWKGKI